MPQMKRIVVCMKWGTLFNATYVNVLFNAVKAHCPSLDQFICITEDATGIHPDVKIQPIPDMPIDASYYAAGAWPKLGLFKRGVLPENSRVLFIDLDMMICGDLDRMFTLPARLYAIGGSSWNAKPKSKRPFWYNAYKAYRNSRKENQALQNRKKLGLTEQSIPPNTMGSGIFLFDGNSMPWIYDEFAKNPAEARARFTNEQHFFEYLCRGWEPWPPGWVIHYKYSLRQPLGIDWFKQPKAPPAEASVVAFSGRPRPDELTTRCISSLAEFPHMRFGRVKWFEKYWNMQN
jgi:hypothetical protein